MDTVRAEKESQLLTDRKKWRSAIDLASCVGRFFLRCARAETTNLELHNPLQPKLRFRRMLFIGAMAATGIFRHGS
jgi:hypothetical protein